MKKTIAVMVLALAPLASVTAQDIDYTITGTAPKEIQWVALVVNGNTRNALQDSIKGSGSFKFSGKAPKDALFTVYYRGEKNGGTVNAFNEGVPVSVDCAAGTAKASVLTDKVNAFQAYLSSNLAIQNRIYRESKQEGVSEQRQKEIKDSLTLLDNESDAKFFQFVRDNRGNVAPVAFISDFVYGFTYDELLEFCDSTTAYYNHPTMQMAKQMLESKGKRRPGISFAELSMQDMDGKDVKLSQWAGKGNYVLVDFWASWCGPCRREMPNVVAAYNKYHASKNFEIVGVSFDQNADKWKEAVKTLGMSWPQMSDLKGWQCAANQVYGVNSIPSNVLLDPQGKIVASDLTGAALGAKLKEIFGE